MEIYLEKQEITAEKIVQLKTNYNKDGAARKTKSYLESKIVTLKGLYTKYIEIDDLIREYTPPLNQDHPYYKEREIISGIYDVLIDDMRERLNPKAPPTSQPTTSADNTQNSKFSSSNINNNDQAERREFNQLIKLQDVKMRALYKEMNTAKDSLSQNASKQTLQLLLKRIERMMEQIMDLDEKINVEASEEDEENLKYFSEGYYDTIKNEHDGIVTKINTVIDNHQIINNKYDVKLPKIEIPMFYGDYIKWKGFADTFEKLVHNNTSLTDTHKINYLKNHLGGAAARLINHLESTADNYTVAYEIIKKRFNNERILTNTYFNQLLNLPNINTENASGIRAMHDTTKEVIHNINNILREQKKFDALIIHILQRKLDNETIRIYETSLDDPKQGQDLETFLLFLEKRFQSLQAINNKNRHPTSSNRQQISTASSSPKALTTTTTNTKKCANCKNSHKIDQCRAFLKMTTLERNKLCTNKNLCRKCLGDHNLSQACSLENKCLVCRGNHHTLLHTNNQGKPTPLTYSTTTESPKPVVETHMVNNTTTGTQILLSTALVKVRTNGNHPELMRILIDPGSQATFITREAAKKLNIQSTRTHVEVKGVGGIKAGTSNQQLRFQIEPRFSSIFRMEINALIVDKLVEKLPESNFNAWKWPHINNVLWADPNYNMPNKIDILLGADYYPAIIMDEIVKGGKNEPVAQKTELGWIIFGPLTST